LNHRRGSATSHRSLPILSKLIDKRSSCDGLTKAERLRLIDRAIRSESAALECEEKMKGLEREIRKLELRNHDLSTEVCWLRQQCTIACPDVPNGLTTSASPSKHTDLCQMESKALLDTVAKQNADLSGLRMKVEQMTASDMRKDIRISELIKELDTAKARIITLEGDNSQQNKHFNDTVKEAGDKKVPSSSNKPTHRATTCNSRPSLRNIAIMDKDHRIDGKVRPSTAFEFQSTKHSTFERGEIFPVLRGHTDVNGDLSDGTKEVVKDSLSDDSDIDVTDILETSQKPTSSV
uniref:Lzipper-MIP1 domain-containing protein n=1 Tax=Angiostrongylus cantonensis TaxID=6313 RepID=A0A0K0DLA8_ANGCA